MATRLSGNLGQTAFTALATSIAPLRFGSVAGWQFALILISVLSALIGLLVLMLVTDVPQAEDETVNLICDGPNPCEMIHA